MNYLALSIFYTSGDQGVRGVALDACFVTKDKEVVVATKWRLVT